MTTTTPKDARILPERIWTNGQFVYKTTASVHRIVMHDDGTETIVFAKDSPECAEYIRADLCTPAIADTTDLFICRRTVAGDNRDGATRYYVYQELRPYDGAIADGVGVEWQTIDTAPNKGEFIAWHPEYKRAFYVFRDFPGENVVVDPVRGRSWRAKYWIPALTPPQAATDEGV